MRPVVGVLLIAMGVLWTLQGLGIVGGSLMTGVTVWTFVGSLVAIAGAVCGGQQPDSSTSCRRLA